jgi:hypothetical protein
MQNPSEMFGGTRDRTLGQNRLTVLDRGSSRIAAKRGFELPRSGRIAEMRTPLPTHASTPVVAPWIEQRRFHPAERVRGVVIGPTLSVTSEPWRLARISGHCGPAAALDMVIDTRVVL